MEQCYWESLCIVRKVLEDSRPAVAGLARRLVEARERMGRHARRPRNHGPRVEAVFDLAAAGNGTPDELMLKPGSVTTLRGEFGRALQFLNHLSRGAILVASADLLGSTSVGIIGRDFPGGYWNAAINAGARTLSIGGICEDAMSGFISGLSAFGHHIGVGSSYAAFLAPLGHIAARLHAIGAQARRTVAGNPYLPMILVCAHAGLKTGEDGPTHADPQALQLLQDNFPRGAAITLTPWDPQEIWPLLTASLARRPDLFDPPQREDRGPQSARACATGGGDRRRIPAAQTARKRRRHSGAAGKRRRLCIRRESPAVAGQGRVGPLGLLRRERGIIR
jgi:transketolase